MQSLHLKNTRSFKDHDTLWTKVLKAEVRLVLQVKGLEFNRVSPNLLASGGADSAINIWDLTNPHKPTNYPAQKVCSSPGIRNGQAI